LGVATQRRSNPFLFATKIYPSRTFRTTSKIETSRGSVMVVPKMPVAEQCYWDVQAGNIARAGGSAYVNPWFGSASSGGAAYQRFFRASCRILDGFVAGCSSNWQN
jgi:hypothetical protein